ncbi:MAG TPA: Holliday junction resolvase RuvX [Xanthomonadaceae bacterium]|jgi:putative Holliday junction resolvase|nr:Holliday junction resolvase RuvX [Xanthomonadaceae bacterium]
MTAGAVLGFDVGARRIGVAVGNGITGTASELGLIEVRDGIPDWSGFDRLLKDWSPAQLVVGDPLNDDPTQPDPPARQRARGFARAAARRSGLPVVLVDERRSSKEAAERFANQRRAGLKRRADAEVIDALAAVIIVERFLAGYPPAP